MNSAEIRAFLADLENKNDKAWFDANKKRFKAEVEAPLCALIGTLDGPLSSLDPQLKAVPKVNGSLRRIYRDTRFSKDKTPYHTHLHLIFWAGDHANRSPGVHVIFNKDTIGFGAGHWAFDDAQLARYRQLVVADGGAKVAQTIAQVEKAGVVLDEPQLARVPRGFDKAAEGADWLRHKGLVVKSGSISYPAALDDLEGATKYVLELCEKMSPLNKFLMDEIWD